MNYRQRPELSYSDLVWLNKSPIHFLNRDKLRKETEAMRKGTLLHMGVLEPEKFKNSYAIEPHCMPDGTEINRRVKAHREYLEGWKQTMEGRIFLRQEDMDSLICMLNALATHKYARRYFTGGEAEKEAFGEYEGVKIKGKCDYITKIPGLGLVISDLKKTQDASPKGFERSIYNYSYQLQAYMYHRLFKADSFFFVAIEDTGIDGFAPIGIYRASDVLLEKGEQMFKKLIEKYKQCEEMKVWPGYTEDFAEISLPAWAIGSNDESP
jgi:hypothetical protein